MTLVFTIISIITFLFLFTKTHCRKSNNLPPSPPALPVLGNLPQLGRLPYRSLTSLSKKYGPIMLLHLGSIPTVVVSSLELAKEVMKTQDLIFCTRPPSSIADRIFYGSRDLAFSPYGDSWRQMRKLCVLHLLSVKRVQEFRSVREEEVDFLLSIIRRESAASAAVNLSKMMSNLSNDIICRVALGRKYTEEKVREMLHEAGAVLASFPVTDFIPWLGWIDEITGFNRRVRKISGEFGAFLDRIVDDHVVHAKGDDADHDLVDVLLSIKEKNEAGSAFTLERQSIKALIWDMFAGGTDTTSSALEWVMTNLITHQASMKRAQEEIRQVVGSKSMVAEEDIDRMEYLMAVIKETLRLNFPVPLLIPREAMQDTKLQGYDIPMGTRVFVNAWAIARDPSQWDKPDEFHPERFLNNSVDFRGQDFQFTPFGAGRRGCPGMNFAVITMQYVLANLLFFFDWEVLEGTKLEALDRTETFSITARKKLDLVLTAKPYSTSFNYE